LSFLFLNDELLQCTAAEVLITARWTLYCVGVRQWVMLMMSAVCGML